MPALDGRVHGSVDQLIEHQGVGCEPLAAGLVGELGVAGVERRGDRLLRLIEEPSERPTVVRLERAELAVPGSETRAATGQLCSELPEGHPVRRRRDARQRIVDVRGELRCPGSGCHGG